MKCPNCNEVRSWCEEINVELGEVIGYHCTECGHETELED